MCDFISWIEKDNKLFYTDNETLRDSFVRKLMKDTRHNDVLGHGFIRKIYNFTGGKEFEVRDFWNFKKLPKEIADKLKNGEMSELWNYMQSNDLKYIIRYASEKYKEKAWKLFLNSDYSNYDLGCLMEFVPEKYKEKAWKLFLKSNYNNYDLRYAIRNAPETYQEKAWKLFLKSNYNNYDLRYLVVHASEKYKEKAWKLFLKSDYNNHDLRYLVIVASEKYKKKAQAILDSKTQKGN